MKIIFKKNNSKTLSFFFIFYWILLWASINTAPGEIYFFNEGYKQSINAARILFPLLASMLIFFSNNKSNSNKIANEVKMR
jgi:hypothetical protein